MTDLSVVISDSLGLNARSPTADLTLVNSLLINTRSTIYCLASGRS